MKYETAAMLVVVALLTGCASIVSGSNQSLSVVAKDGDNQDVVGAKCSLSNDKGQWFATTPGSVTVHRSFGNLAVDCKHQTFAGVGQFPSTTKGMAFGNILFGGVIGVGVDAATGAAYDYPEILSIRMSMIADAPPTSASTGALPVASVAPVPAATAAASAPAAAPVAAPQASVAPAVLTASAPVPLPARPEPTAAVNLPSEPAIRTQPPLMNGGSTMLVAAAPQIVSSKRAIKVGQAAHTVNHLDEVRACNPQPDAQLSGKGPAFETFTVACANLDVLSVRCEYGNCRVLR